MTTSVSRSALQVEGASAAALEPPMKPAAGGEERLRSRRHDTFPRWFRMSAKLVRPAQGQGCYGGQWQRLRSRSGRSAQRRARRAAACATCSGMRAQLQHRCKRAHPPPPLLQAVLTLMLALPVLALRDPQLKGKVLGGNPKYSILFLLLGVIAIPM